MTEAAGATVSPTSLILSAPELAFFPHGNRHYYVFEQRHNLNEISRPGIAVGEHS